MHKKTGRKRVSFFFVKFFFLFKKTSDDETRHLLFPRPNALVLLIPVLVVVFKRCFSSRDGESAHKTHHLLFVHFTHAFVYKSITHNISH